jgi:transcriptional regulator GlxA family with amidase domain
MPIPQDRRQHILNYLLLDGKRVATPWASCDRLADGFPARTVDADSLYVVDGKVGLSAPGRLGHAFERHFGMAPSLFREMHRAA